MRASFIFLGGLTAGVTVAVIGFGILMGQNIEGCGKCVTAQMQLEHIGVALDLYADDHGNYPTEEEGLNSLRGAYLKALSADPWGQDFQYALIERKGEQCYLVWSLGSDMARGGLRSSTVDIFVSRLTSD